MVEEPAGADVQRVLIGRDMQILATQVVEQRQGRDVTILRRGDATRKRRKEKKGEECPKDGWRPRDILRVKSRPVGAKGKG